MIVKDFLRQLGFGMLPELIVFGVALILFIISLYCLVRKRKKIISGLAVILLGAVIVLVNPTGYLYHMIVKSEAGESMAQSALKRLATAQDGYFKDHNKYTKNVGALAKYGFKQSNYPGVLVIINQANAAKWSAKAGHQNSENRFIYSSETGEIKEISE